MLVNKKICHIFVFVFIAAVGFCIYSNSLKGPFLFDDPGFIDRNPAIRDITNYKDIWNAVNPPTRFVTLYSFALNYFFHDYRVFGYHLTNVVIHICNAFCMYWFVSLLLRSPKLSTAVKKEHLFFLNIFPVMIFLTHPLQTQAVSYVCQRFASLATLFYLLSLCFYFQAKFIDKGKGRGICFVFSCLFAVIGVFTKEIIFTLPFTLILTEYFFFDFKISRKYFKKGAVLFALLVLFLLLTPALFSWDVQKNLFPQHESGSHKGDVVTFHNYYLTQFRVVSIYLKLLFLPIGQTLDYDLKVSHSLLVPITTCLGMVFIMLFIFFALIIRKKNALVAYGIFFGFITMAVESSIIPIRNVIFEHRMYLPMVGWSIAGASGIIGIFRNRKKAVAAVLMIIGVLSYLTYQRNFIWSNEIAFWKDNVNKAPSKDRPYVHLGNAFFQKKDYVNALTAFNMALFLDPRAEGTYVNRGSVYLHNKQYDKALNDFNTALQIMPNNYAAFNNRGTLYLELGKYDLALADFNEVIKLNWSYAEAYLNKGTVYYKLGKYDEALAEFYKALEINPSYAKAYFNRGSIYLKLKQYDLAIKDFNAALLNSSENGKIYNNRAIAYAHKKAYPQAVSDFTQAISYSSKDASLYFNRGSIYYEMKDYKSALADLNKAALLDSKNPQYFYKRSLSYKALNLFSDALKDANRAREMGANISEAYIQDLRKSVSN